MVAVCLVAVEQQEIVPVHLDPAYVLLPYRNAGSTASAIWHRHAAASSSKTSLLHIL